MLHDAIQFSFPTVVCCVLMLIFIAFDRSFRRRTSMLFVYAIIVVMCLVFIDNKDLFMADPWANTFFRRFVSALGYTLRPLVAILVTAIFLRREKTMYHYMLIPFVLNAFCSILSVFNGWVFFYDAAGHFQRGPLGVLPFIVSAFYVLTMAYMSLSRFGKHLNSENIVMLVIAAFSVLGTAMDATFGYSGMLNTVCALGITFYYLYLHVRTYSRDPLTSALSRRVFYLNSEKPSSTGMWVVSIDLNDLKKINDTGTHAAGDKALSTLSGAIYDNLKRGCELYRMGGDEFAILCKGLAESEVNAMVQSVREALADTPYSFAYGTAWCSKDGSLDETYALADAKMYGDKERSKSDDGK